MAEWLSYFHLLSVGHPGMGCMLDLDIYIYMCVCVYWYVLIYNWLVKLVKNIHTVNLVTHWLRFLIIYLSSTLLQSNVQKKKATKNIALRWVQARQATILKACNYLIFFSICKPRRTEYELDDRPSILSRSIIFFLVITSRPNLQAIQRPTELLRR
jgi:hypothetical protein